MMRLTAGIIATANAVRLDGVEPNAVITDYVTDSREAKPDALFIAIAGARADGHDFAAEVIAAGCAAVLSSRPLGVPAIIVDDPVLALGRLAHWVRTEILDARVVAVTGSAGKTSTKELIAAVLSTAGPTVGAIGSFNTEVGVPLTILRADPTTEFLVLEMGMRGEGQIRYLAELARPDIGVIVNVGSAHLELLGSRENIAHAKGELVRELESDGVAILNGDDPLVRAQAAHCRSAVLTFGRGLECDVRAEDVRIDSHACAAYTLRYRDQAVPVSLAVAGEHFVENSLAAAAVGLALGLDLVAIGAALRAARLQSKWRMEVTELDDHVTVINDSYNANPESTTAALEALVAMSAGRRSIAVLGEMRELGSASAEEHARIGRRVAELGIEHVVCVGAATAPLAEAARAAGADQVVDVVDPAAAIDYLQSALIPGDVLLIKASRGIALDAVAAAVIDSRSIDSRGGAR